MAQPQDGALTYAVQEDADLATSIDSRLLTAQLADFAEYANSLMRELLEVRSSDAWGCFGHDGVCLNVLFVRVVDV